MSLQGHHSYDDVRGLQGLLKICGGAMPAEVAESPVDVDVDALQAELAASKAELAARDTEVAALEAKNATLEAENAALKRQAAGQAVHGEWRIDRNRLGQL